MFVLKRATEELASLAHVRVDAPEPAECPGEAQLSGRIRAMPPLDCGEQVVVFLLEALRPFSLELDSLDVSLLGEGEKVVRVPLTNIVPFAARIETIEG